MNSGLFEQCVLQAPPEFLASVVWKDQGARFGGVAQLEVRVPLRYGIPTIALEDAQSFKAFYKGK